MAGVSGLDVRKYSLLYSLNILCHKCIHVRDKMVLMDREAPWDHQALLAKMAPLDFPVVQVLLECQAV